VFLITIFFAFTNNYVYCISENEAVDVAVKLTYSAIEKASREGGNVSGLVDELNLIIDKIESGNYDYDDTISRLNNLIRQAGDVQLKAAITVRNEKIAAGLKGAFIIILSYLTWRYFPRLFWLLWFQSRGNWEIQN
jgi:hypothetical protein